MKKLNMALSKPAALLSLMICLSIITIALTLYLGKQRESELSIQSNDLESLRNLIASTIDCDETFAAAKIDPFQPGLKCNSMSNATGQQVAPFLRLKRQTLRGVSQWLTGPLESDGSAQFGNWKIRTTCSDTEQSLVVRAEPMGGAAGSRNVASNTFDMLVFGVGKNGVPICYGSTRAGSTQDYIFSESPASPTNRQNPSPNLKGWNCAKFVPVNSMKPLPPIHANRKMRVRVLFTGNHRWEPSPGQVVAPGKVAYENSIDYSLDNGATWYVPDPKAVVVNQNGTDFSVSVNIDIKAGQTLRLQPIFRHCNDPSEGTQPVFSFFSMGTVSADPYPM